MKWLPFSIPKGKAAIAITNLSIFILLCVCYIAFFNVQVKNHDKFTDTALRTVKSNKTNFNYMERALQQRAAKQKNRAGSTDLHLRGKKFTTPSRVRLSPVTKIEYVALGGYDVLTQGSTVKTAKRFIAPHSEMPDNDLIQRLAKDLKYKLNNAFPEKSMDLPPTCVEREVIMKSCDRGGCLRLQLPRDPKSRVEQLVAPPHLHPNSAYKKVLDDMRNSVPGKYDIILVTGASANHYRESKALLYNLHTNVFPYLKNFTLIYYNLGLTSIQKEDIANICRCHVRDFPFERFPKIFTQLQCYGWKPMIVYAHASRANLIYWMDASIRFFKDPSQLKLMLQLARTRGMQTGASKSIIPRVTLRYMFHFFGDEPCAYHPYVQCTSGNVVLHNEPLIHEAIIAPWAACALNETCMCPYHKVNLVKVLKCGKLGDVKDEYKYEICHRFDQSALSIAARKLYRDKSHYIFQEQIHKFLTIARGDIWREGTNSTLQFLPGPVP